jgi:hypothetical protein
MFRYIGARCPAAGRWPRKIGVTFFTASASSRALDPCAWRRDSRRRRANVFLRSVFALEV